MTTMKQRALDKKAESYSGRTSTVRYKSTIHHEEIEDFFANTQILRKSIFGK